MMSGLGANPMFFNKKINIGRPEHSLTPTLLYSITSHGLTPLSLPPPLKLDVTCVSPLIMFSKYNSAASNFFNE